MTAPAVAARVACRRERNDPRGLSGKFFFGFVSRLFFLVVVFCFAFRSFQLRALPLLLLHLHLLLPLPAASSARPFCFCLLDFFCVLFSPLSLSLSICVASSPAFQSELSDAPTDPPPFTCPWKWRKFARKLGKTTAEKVKFLRKKTPATARMERVNGRRPSTSEISWLKKEKKKISSFEKKQPRKSHRKSVAHKRGGVHEFGARRRKSNENQVKKKPGKRAHRVGASTGVVGIRWLRVPGCVPGFFFTGWCDCNCSTVARRCSGRWRTGRTGFYWVSLTVAE